VKKHWSYKSGRVVCTIAIMGAWSNAHAQSSGSNVISLGWAHIAPQSSSTPLTVTSIGGRPVNVAQPGATGAAGTADTFGIVSEHYFSHNIGVALAGGWPVRLPVYGRGTLAQYGKIGEAIPMAPQLFLRYHLGTAQTNFRPFVGLGVNYSWFTDEQVTNSNFLTQNFGPGGSASIKASSSWNPVFEAGANYAIDKHWLVGFNVSYLPAKTTATLTGHTASGVEVVIQTKVKVCPIDTFLNVSYVF